MDKDDGEKGWWINRSTKRLLIVTTNLDGISLANCWWFTKFAEIFHPTFPLYGIVWSMYKLSNKAITIDDQSH